MEYLHDIFRYEDGKIYWLISPSRRAKIGGRAGHYNSYGYRLVTVNGQRMMEHKVIWEMHNGSIPDGMVIDHINHVTDDNKIENLRLASKSGNASNRRIQKNNTSGVPGVSWSRDSGKWQAKCKLNGRDYYLGLFDDLDEAELVVISARKRMHGEFANITKRADIKN